MRAALWWLLPLVALARDVRLGNGLGTRRREAARDRGDDRAEARGHRAAARIRDTRRCRRAHRNRRAHALQSDPPPRAADGAGGRALADEARSVRADRERCSSTARTRLSCARSPATSRGASKRAKRSTGCASTDVKADRVVLALGDESEELVLKVATNPRPTPAPVVATPQQAPAVAAAPAPAPAARPPREPQRGRGGSPGCRRRRQSSDAARRAPRRQRRRRREEQPTGATPRHRPAGTRSTSSISNALAVARLRSERKRLHSRDIARPHLEANMTRQKPAYACSALAAAFLVAGCATQPDVGTPPTTKTLPNRGTSGVSLALADAAERAQKPGLPTPEEKARLFKGTGVLVKGQQPGRRAAFRPGRRPAGRRRSRSQLRGGGPARSRAQHPRRRPQRELHDRRLGGRPGDDPHVGGHPARRADRHARDAAANERRGDGQGGRPLQDPAERRRRSAAT